MAREGRLSAHDLDGETLWELDVRSILAKEPLRDLDAACDLQALAPAPGRVLAKGRDGSVFCFG